MPIIKRIKGRAGSKTYNTLNGLQAKLKYIMSDSKTKKNLIGIHNLVSKNNIFEQFVLTKKIFNKLPSNNKDTSNRLIVEYVQSFPSGDKNITPEIAKKIADEFINSIYFKNFQVIYAVHTNREHIHTHFIINTTNIKNGKQWQQSKIELEDMKKISDEISMKHGIDILMAPFKNYKKDISQKEYYSIKNKTSFKHKIFIICKEARKKSWCIEDFVNEVEKNGVQVRITPTRKDITYSIDGKKINSDKLGYVKKQYLPFTKEKLEEYFSKKLRESYNFKYYNDLKYILKNLESNEKTYRKELEKLGESILDISKNEKRESINSIQKNKRYGLSKFNYKIAKKLYEIGDYNFELLKGILTKSIEYVENKYAMYLLYKICLENDRKDEALEYLEKDIELSDERAIVDKLRFYVDEDEIERELNKLLHKVVFKEYYTIYSTSKFLIDERGKIDYGLKFIDKLKELAIEENKDSTVLEKIDRYKYMVCLREAKNCYYKDNNIKLSLKYLREATKICNSSEILYLLAISFFSLGKIETGKKYLKRSSVLGNEIARLKLIEYSQDEERKVLLESLEKSTDYRVQFEVAKKYLFNLHDKKKAINCLDTAISTAINCKKGLEDKSTENNEKITSENNKPELAIGEKGEREEKDEELDEFIKEVKAFKDYIVKNDIAWDTNVILPNAIFNITKFFESRENIDNMNYKNSLTSNENASERLKKHKREESKKTKGMEI